MSFPAYPEYKDSGVPWLGKVPGHWEVAALKRQSRLVTLRADQRTFPVALENIEGWTGRFLPTATEFEGDGVAFEPGDILYGKLRPYLAKILVAERGGEAIGDFHVIRPNGQDPHFLSYLLRARELVSVVDGSTYGSKMPRASWDFLGALAIGFPPLSEQTAIAAFLDRETAKIDALVAEQERLIALLKEKRQAVISHAVTKGLNPDAPMKDSGIEWLGDIPTHWAVRAVWMLFSLGRGRVLSHEDIAENEGPYPVYSSQTENEGCMGLISTFDFEGDYLTWTTDGANAGTVFRRSGRFNCTNVCGTLKPKTELDLDFCQAAISQAIGYFVRQDINPKLMNNVMSGIKVQLPPLSEQKAIIEHVHSATGAFKCLISEAQSAITLLQERRAALISAAVTGKIDVRGLVDAPATAELETV